ncbi:unnamed protein product, partial [Amoebophrya sp. A25]
LTQQAAASSARSSSTERIAAAAKSLLLGDTLSTANKREQRAFRKWDESGSVNPGKSILSKDETTDYANAPQRSRVVVRTEGERLRAARLRNKVSARIEEKFVPTTCTVSGANLGEYVLGKVRRLLWFWRSRKSRAVFQEEQR